MEENKTISELAAAFKAGNQAVFEGMYLSYFSLVEQLVRKNHGTKEEAREVFQESMIVLFKNVRDNKISNMEVATSTYLYAIARNLWLTALKRKKNYDPLQFSDEVELNQSVYEEVNLEEHLDRDQKFDKIKQALSALKEECRNIVMYSYYQKLSLTVIAEKLGYTESFIKVKKYRCMEQLKKLVLNA